MTILRLSFVCVFKCVTRVDLTNTQKKKKIKIGQLETSLSLSLLYITGSMPEVGILLLYRM